MLLLVVATAATAGDQPDVPGRHGAHGRFSAAAAGYPPQPVGITAVTPVAVSGFAAGPQGRRDAAADAAVATALSDPAVARSLGHGAELVGVVADVDDTAPAGRGPVVHEVTWVDAPAARSVVATVTDGGEVAVEVVPAAVWQPPLTGAEVDRAIDIARDHWVADGHPEAADLQGFAMHVMDDDGSYPATRMAYATFARHVDARPTLLTWVDLTDGAVVRTRVESGEPSPDAPSHRSLAGAAGAPRAGELAWRGWELGYEVSGRMDGVALTDVRWRGVEVLARASMPAMTVFYEGDACGPFVDRLGGELTPVDWAGGAEVVVREVEVLGEPWLELGVLDTLGEYVLYQSFYLSPDGQLDAHTFAKGVQCEVDHVHHPFWRFDVALGGRGGERVVRDADGRRVVEPVEFDRPADAATDHGWRVEDAATGHAIDVAFDDGSWNVPGEVVPEVLYAMNVVSGRRFAESEDGTWRLPAVRELPPGGGDALDGEDVVLWYRGVLPHAAAEGPALWHSTGVRLTVDLSTGHYVRPR